MLGSVIVNTLMRHNAARGLSGIAVLCSILWLSVSPFYAQSFANGAKIEPFEDLLKRPVAIKPELMNVHPRLFFTAKDIEKFRSKAKGPGRELWEDTIKAMDTLDRTVP